MRVSVQLLRVKFALVHQLIGWSGLAGISLMVSAVCVAGAGLFIQRIFLESATGRPGTSDPAAITVYPKAVPEVEANSAAPELPQRAEIPLLLKEIHETARSNGLAWPAAGYRIVAATSSQPSSLEVSFAVKGSYPKLRAMLVQMKAEVPALAIRQFSVSRPNSDTLDVEAKLVLAVFIADDPVSSDAVQLKTSQ